MSGPYDDIIGLPHHVSATRPQMSISNRAAQFAPFAAVTGYDAAIHETARLTSTRIELDEDAIADVEMKLRLLTDMTANHPEISVTHFRPDEKKEGGEYVTDIGAFKMINEYENTIVLMNGKSIRIADVLNIESEQFKALL